MIRDNYRLVWCQSCPAESTFHQIMKGGELGAHRKAQKHSRRWSEHVVVVIDLTTLTEEHRYHFVPLPDVDEPPF